MGEANYRVDVQVGDQGECLLIELIGIAGPALRAQIAL